MIKILAFVFLPIILLTSSCNDETYNIATDGTGTFCCKKGYFAFCNFKNNIASLYFTPDLKYPAKQLTFPKKGWDFPFDISKDIEKILYINYSNADYEFCNICIYNLQSGTTDTLIKNIKLITEACLSNDDKHVYFITASEIQNYSPIARSAPHGMDIFEINVETKILRKVTRYNAYSIQALTSTDSDTLLCVNMFDKQGLVFISIKSGKYKKIKINSERNVVKEYFFPVDIRKDSILFEVGRDLYKYNQLTKKCELIFTCPDYTQFGKIQVDESWENIIFNNEYAYYNFNIPNETLTRATFKISTDTIDNYIKDSVPEIQNNHQLSNVPNPKSF